MTSFAARCAATGASSRAGAAFDGAAAEASSRAGVAFDGAATGASLRTGVSLGAAGLVGKRVGVEGLGGDDDVHRQPGGGGLPFGQTALARTGAAKNKNQIRIFNHASTPRKGARASKPLRVSLEKHSSRVRVVTSRRSPEGCAGAWSRR